MTMEKTTQLFEDEAPIFKMAIFPGNHISLLESTWNISF